MGSYKEDLLAVGPKLIHFEKHLLVSEYHTFII